MEKAASELKKAGAGRRHGGEEEGGQPGGVMERDQGGRPRSGTVEMLAIGLPTAGQRNGARPVEMQRFFFLRMEISG